MSPSGEARSERVLVLTPTGRDADMLRERLDTNGMASEICASLSDVLAGMRAGAGAAVIAQEALTPRGAAELLAALEAQEPWSDIPVLLLSEARSRKRPQVATGFFERANVTLLQRPLDLQLFLSSVRSAVRARRRQYQMRDLHRELQRAVQLSDLFVSILGHDLRNPLSAIKLAAELIVRQSPDPRALRPAGRILTAADRMTRMIVQLLDFARVRQGGGIPLHRERMDLGALCAELVEELEGAHPGARLEVRRTGSLLGTWDADRLAQLLSNLIANAAQHGTSGAPITVELDGSAAALVRVCVRNQGAIDPDALPSLFDAFKRAERPARRSSRSGLGLGLFIAREIARAHGGELEVQPDADQTCFSASLPRAPPAARQQ